MIYLVPEYRHLTTGKYIKNKNTIKIILLQNSNIPDNKVYLYEKVCPMSIEYKYTGRCT